MFDEGKTRINSSTWRKCGRALAAFLSLREFPDDSNDESLTTSQWRNKQLYISSFKISRRDMFDSLHRVIGTTDEEWNIRYQPTAERYENGLDDMKKGIRLGFLRAVYARVFFPNGGGDFESSRGLANYLLELPKEDPDEATKRTFGDGRE
jgi:hypothetical protein